MRYYPVNLDIDNRNCLVVGGGAVGRRKVITLLTCGARVTVVSPDILPELARMANDGTISLRQRPYTNADLDGMFLVIGATDDESLNRTISREANQRNMLCNIADFPEGCNFILPAIVQRGDMTLTVSTSGKSPAFAKHMRIQLENMFGEEYGEFLRLMGSIRENLLREAHAPEEHKPLFEALIRRGLLDLVGQGNSEAIDALLLDILGEGYKFEDLMKTGS